MLLLFIVLLVSNFPWPNKYKGEPGQFIWYEIVLFGGICTVLLFVFGLRVCHLACYAVFTALIDHENLWKSLLSSKCSSRHVCNRKSRFRIQLNRDMQLVIITSANAPASELLGRQQK